MLRPFSRGPSEPAKSRGRSTWPTTGKNRTASRDVTLRRASARRPPAWRLAATCSNPSPLQGRLPTILVVSASAARATRSSAGFAQLKNVEIKTLCDIDANLGAERVNDKRARRRRRPSSPASSRTCAACSTTRTSTPSSSRRRTTGTRSRRSGRCRPASTSTSRSRRRTRSGKAARWSRRRRAATARSSRSAR